MATRKKPVVVDVKEIGIVSTHRAMNTRLHYRLPKPLQHVVRVDTPERWQGLERKMMIAVHPLSGVTDPTACRARDRPALRYGQPPPVWAPEPATRDDVADTLRTHIVSVDQAVGRADVAGIGHHRHGEFWGRLQDDNRVVAL